MGGEESQLAWIVGQFVVGEEIEGTNELYSTSTFVSSESIPLPFPLSHVDSPAFPHRLTLNNTNRPQIESALTGAIYDPLIRLLLWEGVRSWWRLSLPSWLSCPSSLSLLPAQEQTILTSSNRLTTTSEIVCPVHWASGTHKVTCELAFPPEYDEHSNPPVEVGGNTPYYRKIAGESPRSSFHSLRFGDRGG